MAITAAVGVRVVAIAASQDGNYDIGHTGVICSIPSHVNPMVRWDHSGKEHQSSRAKLNVTKRRTNFVLPVSILREGERASRNGSTVVDICHCLFYSKTPKHVFVNPINIFDIFYTLYLLFFNYTLFV